MGALSFIRIEYHFPKRTCDIFTSQTRNAIIPIVETAINGAQRPALRIRVKARLEFYLEIGADVLYTLRG